MLDFVPNHMALDHPWTEEHPDYFVHGSDRDLARTPQNYCRVTTRQDSLLLDYGKPATQDARIRELLKVAEQCDRVRCDMAMLILREVFERTWGLRAEPFWPNAIA